MFNKSYFNDELLSICEPKYRFASRVALISLHLLIRKFNFYAVLFMNVELYNCIFTKQISDNLRINYNKIVWFLTMCPLLSLTLLQISPFSLYETLNLVTHCFNPGSDPFRPCVTTPETHFKTPRSTCIHWLRSLVMALQAPILGIISWPFKRAELGPWYRSHSEEAVIWSSDILPSSIPRPLSQAVSYS